MNLTCLETLRFWFAYSKVTCWVLALVRSNRAGASVANNAPLRDFVRASSLSIRMLSGYPKIPDFFSSMNSSGFPWLSLYFLSTQLRTTASRLDIFRR